MPKAPQSASLSPPSHSSTSTSTFSTSPGAGSHGGPSETALKKKKNADAQAAFRARRANYISTLEETVTSLESVVIQLQDSCREARNEAAMLSQENYRLKNVIDTLKEENRRREKYFDALLSTRKSSDYHSFVENFQPTVFSSASSHLEAGIDLQSSQISANTFDSDSSADGGRNKPDSSFNNYSVSPGTDLYQNVNGDQPSDIYSMKSNYDVGVQHPRYFNQYGNSMKRVATNETSGSDREFSMNRAKMSSQEMGQINDGSGQGNYFNSPYSSSYSASPSISSTEMLIDPQGRMVDELSKYGGKISSDISTYPPTESVASSPSNASSSSSLGFMPTLPEGHGRLENNVCHGKQGNEILIYGGTADVSSLAKGTRRYPTGPERPMLGSATSASGVEYNIQPRGLRPRSHTFLPYPTPLRSRQALTELVTSRSPSPRNSPTQPQISSTLAVIKAQAFGALRKTRSRPRRTSNAIMRGSSQTATAFEQSTTGQGRHDSDDDEDEILR